jgi:uncharacterized protein
VSNVQIEPVDAIPGDEELPMSRVSQAPLAVLCAALLTIMGAGMTQAQSPSPSQLTLERTITVSGAGNVVVEPDMAHITLGVVSEADTAKAALEKNTASMTAIVTALKASGLPPKDIQTSNFSVNPRYRPTKGGEQPVINGYQVSNTVRIVVREIAKLGTILDQVIQLGSNQVHGIGFEASKAEQLKDDARKAAISNARHKAELYAAAAGVKLGRVLGIEEAGVQPAVRQQFAKGRAMSMESAPPIEAGSQRLDAHVTVTFALE